MDNNSELSVTWSSIAKYYPNSTVKWYAQKNGIPRFELSNENVEKVIIDEVL